MPGVIFADEALIRAMDDKVAEQVANVATLPGIVEASFAMPDAHWGYGFPIGGVAAFDPDEGGVVSAGGVGFDISCGVRTLLTGLTRADVLWRACSPTRCAARIPAGVGSTGALRLRRAEMDAMLRGGARWAVAQGYGDAEDLERIEEGGCMAGAEPAAVSDAAKRRQRDEMGTLGSGNHYLEVQDVVEVHDRGRRGVRPRRRATWSSASTAGRAGSATRSARNSCARWRSPRRPRASRCPTASSPARRSARRSGSATWARCARPSTARSRTGRSSRIWRARRSARAARDEAGAALRRLAQHLQGRKPRRRRQVARAVRAPQGRDAGVRPGPFRAAACAGATGQPVLIGGSMGTASYVLAGTRGSGRRRSRRRATGRAAP